MNINKIYDILKNVHLVLIMTVEPGKSGQKLIDKTLEKIKEISEYIKNNNIDITIEADGGINMQNIELLKEAGTEIVVSGTGIINTNDYKETIKNMKLN